MTVEEQGHQSPFSRRPAPVETGGPDLAPTEASVVTVPSSPRAKGPGFRFTLLHALIGLQVFLIIGIGWYFLHSPGAGAAVPSASAKAVTVASTPAPPRLSVEERRAATQALEGLQGLRSVTEAGLNYMEYSRRLLDGKVQVDRYLNASKGSTELKAKMAEALELYLFAGDAWNAKINKSYIGIGADPRIDMCLPARELRDRATSRGYLSIEEARGISVAVSVPLVWGCASARTREVEQMLRPES